MTPFPFARSIPVQVRSDVKCADCRRPSGQAPFHSATPMTIELFAHPFSSYCQKALIAFYENDVPFTYG